MLKSQKLPQAFKIDLRCFSFRVVLFPVLLFSHAFAQYVPGVNNNVTLLSQQNRYNGYSNIWGYTDSLGNDYALVGADLGLSVVSIADPQRPLEVVFVPGPGPTGWREIKTYSHYAYVVSEATSPTQYTGIQIVDLSTLPDSVKFHSYLWPNVTAQNARAHSISVDGNGHLYIQGGSATLGTGGRRNGGVRILSLADPENPAPVAVIDTRYVHDSFTFKNILFNSNIFDGGHLDIFDVSNHANPKLLTSITYPDGFSHNSGTTEDGNYLITTDETTDASVKFWDIRVLWDDDPANDGDIELAAEYEVAPGTIAHNVHVKGRYAYLSHYTEGVKVLDIFDPRAPVEIGYYDTHLAPGSGFTGDWGVFPYFPSGNFVVSDIQNGLYVLRLDSTGVGEIRGKITNRETGTALAGATLRFIEAGKTLTTDGSGEYRLRTNAGTHTVVIRAFPFQSDTSKVNLNAGAPLVYDRRLEPLLQISTLRGKVHDNSGKGIRAKVTLFASSNIISPYTLTDSSDASGDFVFENVYTSSPPLLTYAKLVIEPVIPYVTETLENITVTPGAPTVLDFPLAPADVLLVNDDPQERYLDYYLTALQTLNVTAYHWSQARRGPVPVGALRAFNRNVIIWYTGDAAGEEVLTNSERDSIASHLDRGGRIFLTGQNIVESLQGSAFLRDHLHVAFVQNTSDFQLHGLPGDPVGDGLNNMVTAGAGGANNQNSRDVLQPEAGAHACVVYDLTTGSTAGVRVEDSANRSRLVLLGFGLEALVKRVGFTSRENVLQNVLNWFDGVTGVQEPAEAARPPSEFRLSASYPNPFRAPAHETVVRYDLPAHLSAQRVSLKVYDSLGREVATLVENAYIPGTFTARWNGRDALGEMVKSGVYFYKLRAGEVQQVRKLVFVR